MPDPNAKPPSGADSNPSASSRPPATLLQVIGAVFWSFFGVRKGKAMQRDAASIKPHQVIIVGVLIAAALVATLLILVRIITRSG
jgi:hypothetical protein